ncbi:6-phospho-3-hexuloisomerase [Lachnospiraceae bacterium 38-10]
MTTKEILLTITDELADCFADLKEEQLSELEEKIRKTNKIFVAGAGRSLMMIRGFAMRLMHMGYRSYVVGETSTPALEAGDLLIIASGSGNTETLTVIADKCKRLGGVLALITTMPDSHIGKKADCIVHVPAATTKNSANTRRSIQPGANTFEQSVLLLGDAVIIRMMSGKTMDANNEKLMKLHANLE